MRSNIETSVRFTIDHFTDTHAILRTDDAQELRVPIAELPEGAEEGGVLTFPFVVPPGSPNDRTQQAKDTLNELLGGGHETP